ncbi:MAG: RHS repeat domain-containing protein [Chitinophagaceae bacterium]
MKFLLPACLLVTSSLHAQYYYNDIIGTEETNRQMKTYLENKVRSVSASGYDQRGTKATDFAEVQEVKENGRALRVSSLSNMNRTVMYSRYDEKGRVTSMIDSSTAIESITTYDYDANGRITRIKNTVKDSASDFNQEEIHLWSYNTNGKAEKMWRIINNTDSLEVRLIPDENGNPGDERSYKRGVETGQYYYYLDEEKKPKYVQTGVIYYYYDDRKRVTDIVRFNLKAKRLLPDVMFEYDDKDRMIQKITTTSSVNLGYLIWRYIFDEKGLKSKEALFNDDKQLTGKIEYNYTFGQ